MRLASGVIISQNFDEVLESLRELKTDEIFTIIRSQNNKEEDKEFLVEHAKETIAKAFVTSEVLNYIILIGTSFSAVVQNRLLKILEEPPKNKAFIIITQSKSTILDTIKSRMPITVIKESKVEEVFSLDIENLNLQKIYDFVQEHRRIPSNDCKEIVQKISILAMKSEKYNLNSQTLKLFSDSIKALDLGSPGSFVLNTILLKLLARKRK
jgi:DNA polymerase-3 subunit delta'